MSELQRSFARAQLARLPPEAPLIFDEREEDEAGDEDDEDMKEKHARSASDSSASSTGTVVPSPTKHLFERPKR
jgi:protein phosphatase methylesterase 1